MTGKTSRIIATALLLLMMLPPLASCAGGNDTAKLPDISDDDTQGRDTGTETVAESEQISTGVPDSVRFDGKTVSVLLRDDKAYEFTSDAITGEIVNDAVYARDLAIEERLGIKFNFVEKPGSAHYADYNGIIRTSVNSGSDEFQLVTNYSYYGVSLASQGLFINLCDLEYLDLDKPWWSASFTDEMTVGNKLYFLVGDLTTTATERLVATFMNRDLAKDYFPDVDVGSLVKNGSWTIESLLTLVKPVYKDLDGDNSRDVDDLYGLGLGLGSMCVDGLMAGLGIKVTEKDDDGYPTLALNNQTTVSAVETLYKLYFESDGVVYGTTAAKTYYGSKAQYYMGDKFADGELVFNFSILMDASDILRNLTSDYAIYPLPKLDESQSAYTTTPQDSYSIVSIPKTVVDTDMTSATLALLGSESYSRVRPAYFETAFKTKYLRDEESAQMFDLIVDGAVYNFGVVYSNSLANPVHIVRNLIVNKSKDFASTYKAYEKILVKSLTTLTDYYKSDAN